jgi:hypothetical protein
MLSHLLGKYRQLVLDNQPVVINLLCNALQSSLLTPLQNALLLETLASIAMISERMSHDQPHEQADVAC